MYTYVYAKASESEWSNQKQEDSIYNYKKFLPGKIITIPYNNDSITIKMLATFQVKYLAM